MISVFVFVRQSPVCPPPSFFFFWSLLSTCPVCLWSFFSSFHPKAPACGETRRRNAILNKTSVPPLYGAFPACLLQWMVTACNYAFMALLFCTRACHQRRNLRDMLLLLLLLLLLQLLKTVSWVASGEGKEGEEGGKGRDGTLEPHPLRRWR